MSEERGSLGTGLLLFLLGAAAGAVVVALTTPKSGPELLADLRHLSRRLRHKAREAGKHFRATGRRVAGRAPGSSEEAGHGHMGI
ncbi:MAG: hypothetical protein ABSH53_22805 [Holophaga sp.]|jgi:gas vesicle protein